MMLTKLIIENTLLILGEAFWLSSAYSQLRKLKHTRNTKGLFAPTITLNAAGNVAWMTYFLSEQLLIPVATNLAMFTLTVLTLSYLLADKKQFLKALSSILIIGPITALIILRFPEYSGWTGMVFNMIAATPWLYHVITTKRTSGLSEQGLYFAFGALLCTLAYGIMVSAEPLVTGCIQGIAYTSVIARYYYRYRNRH